MYYFLFCAPIRWTELIAHHTFRYISEQLQGLSIQQQQQQHSSGQNTSADLAKIQDLESSKAS